MNQQEITLAAIGDLEVTRRALIMEIQARDAYIKELEERLGIVRNEDGTFSEDPMPNGNGSGLLIPDKDIVLP